jgi:hypothetical protein
MTFRATTARVDDLILKLRMFGELQPGHYIRILGGTVSQSAPSVMTSVTRWWHGEGHLQDLDFIKRTINEALEHIDLHVCDTVRPHRYLPYRIPPRQPPPTPASSPPSLLGPSLFSVPSAPPPPTVPSTPIAIPDRGRYRWMTGGDAATDDGGGCGDDGSAADVAATPDEGTPTTMTTATPSAAAPEVDRISTILSSQDTVAYSGMGWHVAETPRQFSLHCDQCALRMIPDLMDALMRCLRGLTTFAQNYVRDPQVAVVTDLLRHRIQEKVEAVWAKHIEHARLQGQVT